MPASARSRSRRRNSAVGGGGEHEEDADRRAPCICLLTATGGAQQPASGRAELTPLDYIEIQQLAVRYAYGLDSTADNGYMYADVFTPDGEFVGRQVPLTQGREALARVARSVRKGNPMYVRHFIANHEIHPSPEGATGKVYLMVVDVEEGQPSSIYIGGRTRTCT